MRSVTATAVGLTLFVATAGCGGHHAKAAFPATWHDPEPTSTANVALTLRDSAGASADHTSLSFHPKFSVPRAGSRLVVLCYRGRITVVWEGTSSLPCIGRAQSIADNGFAASMKATVTVPQPKPWGLAIYTGATT